MRFAAQPISNLRLTRFHRWAMLWLKWFVAFLDGAAALAPLSRQAETVGHRWLDRIERIIFAIVMLRAVRRIRCIRTHRPFAVHRVTRGRLSRAVMGSALRRALRPKDLRARIEALRQNIDTLIARLLKRLPRGLTRRRPILMRPECGVADQRQVSGAPALAADTS